MSYFNMDWIGEYLPGREIRVVFDVGSHNGGDALRFKARYPQARVVAIEADSSLFDEMTANKRTVSLEVYNYAVCDHDGQTMFYHNNGTRRGSGSIYEPQDHIYRYEGMSFSAPYEIPAIRLDTLCLKLGIKEIDIIHMDIQGAEYDALIGLGVMRPAMIFLEFGYNYYKGAISPAFKLGLMGYKYILKTKGDELWIR